MSNPELEQKEPAEKTANEGAPLRQPENRALKISNNILIASIIIALIWIVLLFITNTRLRRERTELLSRLSGQLAGAPSAQVGDVVPQFEGRSPDDTQSNVVYEATSKYLFFIFSPLCEVCTSEFPTWNEIGSDATSHGYKVIGLATYSESALQSTPAHNFGVVVFPSMAIQRAYRIVAVPTVMVVSGSGRIDWIQSGKLSKDKIKELLSIIDATKH
jgi:peroxiredoxin